MHRLHAALSCLQGEPAGAAARELLAIGFSSLQLTAGCAPSDDLDDAIAGCASLRTHHGFSRVALRQKVWADGLKSTQDSIHPPTREHAEWLWALDPSTAPVIEVMYGPYTLGNAAEVRRAMNEGFAIAVDVSHLFIQLHDHTMTESDVTTLLEYDRIAEIHVSHNDGIRDSHQPLRPDSYGLDWAAERTDVPVVFEGYLHRLTPAARRAQLEILHDALV